MACDFWVTFSQASPRAQEWLEVYGSLTVPVRGPVSLLAKLPGLGLREVYMLDLESLCIKQREALKSFLAGKFGLSAEEAEAEMEAGGVPILAGDCSLEIRNPARWVID